MQNIGTEADTPNPHPIETVPIATDRALQREFIRFPKDLYRDEPRYVPAFDLDIRSLLRKRHPYFGHSDGTFFLVRRGTRTAGRFLITENTRYNAFHGTRYAFFDLLEFEDDQEVIEEIVRTMMTWAAERSLSAVVGPMLSGGAGGAGILVEGFDHLPAMTMMRYNPPYYQTRLEGVGFGKLVDLHSFRVEPTSFKLPDRVNRLAELVLQRGRFSVLRFASKRELRRVVGKVKQLYGSTFSHHVEDYPLSEEELDHVAKDLLTVVDPRRVALLAYDDEVVGFALGFPDISSVLQRNDGRIGPLALLRIVGGMKRTGKILFNGLGILPQYHGLGGNALLYRELARIVEEGHFKDVEMVQISEQTGLMLRDAGTLGGTPFKVHRLYRKPLSHGE